MAEKFYFEAIKKIAKNRKVIVTRETARKSLFNLHLNTLPLYFCEFGKTLCPYKFFIFFIYFLLSFNYFRTGPVSCNMINTV